MFHLGISLLESRTVTRLLWLAAAFGCVSLASAQPRAVDPAKAPAPADETTRLLKAQVALAKKGYEIESELLTQTKRSGSVLVWSGRPEKVYQWSVSWLKAERELSSRKEAKLAALEAHLKRMTELRKKMSDLAKDLVPRRAELETEGYRLEAELWLARAKKTESATLRVIHPEKRTSDARIIGNASFVESYERTSIYPKMAAFIEKWDVDIGDKVKKGDVLATLFVPELKEDYATKKAEVDVADGRIELAKRKLKVKQAEIKTAEARVASAKAVLKSKPAPRDAEGAAVVAERELSEKKAAAEEAEAAIAVAVAQRKVAVSDAKRMEKWLGYLTLTAPYDGVVTARNVNTFDYVNPVRDKPVYVIDRTDIVRVVVSIPEEDAPFVRIGVKAWVKIPAFQDKPIPTCVTRTSWALDEKSRTMRAEIELQNPRNEILPGMYAFGKVYIQGSRSFWALPITAVEENGKQSFYWEYKNGRAVRRRIETRASDGKWVEIIKRLSPGAGSADRWVPIDGSEKVLVGDLSTLTDGKAVKVSDTPSSP